MKKFHYYDKSKWDAYQLCSMKPVEPVMIVEADDILQADKLFQKETGIDPVKSPLIAVTLQPLIY
jgi:hypothetical protein